MNRAAQPAERAAGSTDERFVLDSVRAWATQTDSPRPPDGDGWLGLAADAGVLATVADVLRRGGRELPDDVRGARVVAAATSMRTMLELQGIDDALGALRWLVLKGPVLADVVYRTRATRTYDDVDVLVHPADLGAALDALESAGFRLLDRNWPMIRAMGRGELSLTGRTGAVIDLHWHPINDPTIRSALPVDVCRMFADAAPVVVDGRATPSLCPADLVVYVALHACLSGGHRLRWLLDIHQAVQWSGCSPEELADRARLHGLGALMRVMLDRSASYVDPMLHDYARAAAPGSAWTALTRVVSRAEAPVASEPGRHTGRSVFAATRPTSGASARALLTGLRDGRRDRAAGRDHAAEVTALHRPVDSPVDREAWLADAAAHAT